MRRRHLDLHSSVYAGDLVLGDIYRGNVRHGTAERFIDAPDGRQALGLAADLRHGLLFVAGGPTAQAYIYDLASGATVTTYQLGEAGSAFVNDVTTTRDGAWFTDSFNGHLFFVPVSRTGEPGTAQTLTLSGPAADTSSQFNLNGIRATANGKTLIVAHTGNAALYTVDPTTGASAQIAGVSVPNVDGIELSGHRLWAVQNFQIPTTAAKFGHLLAAVNAKFDTGVPPTATQFEVVVVPA